MALRPWRVLIVEDELVVRRVLQRCAERAGWEGVCVASAEEAYHLFLPGRFRAAIVDVLLPEGRDGLQFAQTLRGVEPGLKLLLMSGYAANEKRTRQAGFQHFLPKPFDAGEVIGWLQSLRPPRREPLRPRSALVVEDDPAVREFLMRFIDSAGWAVVGAKNGVEALEVFEQGRFGWLVADVVLGDEMDGIDVAKALLKKDPRLGVAMISGVPGVAERVEAERVGAFFPKPVGVEALADLLGLDGPKN